MSGMLTGWAHRRWIGSIRMKEEQRMRAIGFAALAFAAAVATPAVGECQAGMKQVKQAYDRHGIILDIQCIRVDNPNSE